jgi:hypothetical protein
MFENRPEKLKQIINSRWFPVLDLVCASAASLVWFLRPELSWWPLLLALLPWFIRLASGYFPFKRTPFDLLFLVFLITAGLGVWVSYDTPGALGKFWVILGSIFLYYALAAQPKANLVFVAGLLSMVGLVVALTVFFDSSLQEYTADLGLIQRSIDRWSAVRPAWQVNALSPNVSGGILAMLLPFPLLLSFAMLVRGKVTISLAALISTVLVVAALIFTSSRGAWVALAVAAGVLALIIILRPVIRLLTPTQQAFLAATLIGGTFLVTGYIIFNSREIAKVMDLLPGFPFGISRLDLLNNTWNLLADFPFTGGGLRAFPGLYSEYILHIPYLFLEYSHHLYMDIALEQGAVGFFSFIVVLLGSLFIAGVLVLKNQDLGQAFYMQAAVIAGLVITMIHGLIDNPLYGMQGTPLLFLIPGVGAALDNNNILHVGLNEKVSLLKYRALWGSLLFGLLLLLFMGQSIEKAVSAAGYANLGSVYMSKAELANFPADTFGVLPDGEPYLKARGYFLQALSNDPMNTTANYRLGLMSSQDLDFATSIPYLERAYKGNSGHRGIQKALGYNYVWTDRPEAAVELLSEIPEARYELEVYVWWWESQGRPDLAAKSKAALEYFKSPS